MKVQVTGYNPVKFEKDGKNIEGVKVHYIYEDQANESLVGKAVNSVWVNNKIAQGIDFIALVGAQFCEIEFNQKGQLIDVYPNTVQKAAGGF